MNGSEAGGRVNLTGELWGSPITATSPLPHGPAGGNSAMMVCQLMRRPFRRPR